MIEVNDDPLDIQASMTDEDDASPRITARRINDKGDGIDVGEGFPEDNAEEFDEPALMTEEPAASPDIPSSMMEVNDDPLDIQASVTDEDDAPLRITARPTKDKAEQMSLRDALPRDRAEGMEEPASMANERDDGTDFGDDRPSLIDALTGIRDASTEVIAAVTRRLAEVIEPTPKWIDVG
ncbi:MAG TPA: hypothetical protein VMI75_03790 [Polyangiaceae bacterium]|nr:hypothetical protein [Polyangiaceae bacterium]